MPSCTLTLPLLTLQNDFAVLQIDLGAGKCTSLKVLGDNEPELIPQGKAETFVKYWEFPQMEGPDKGKISERRPDSLEYYPSDAQSGMLKAFFSTGVEICLGCRAEAAHFFFELHQIDGPETETAKIGAVLFGAVALMGQHYGDLIGAVENDGFVTAHLPLNLFTQTHSGQWSTRTPVFTIRSQCYRAQAEGWEEFSLTGAQTALLACPEAGCLERLESIVEQYDLPKPQQNGVWHKRHPDIRRSYLLVDITGANYTPIIQLAKKGKFGHIMPFVGVWANSIGSYLYENNPNFPPPNTLQLVVDKIHQQGLKFGLHHLAFLVEKEDPAAENEDQVFPIGAYYLAKAHSSLAQTMAERLKTICQELGVNFVFLDGADLTHLQFPPLTGSSAQWYAGAFSVEKLAKDLSGNIIVQTSATSQNTAYLWYRITRGSAGDYVAIGVEPHLDHDRIAFRRDRRYHTSCMLTELGWFGFFAKLKEYRQGTEEKTGIEIYNKSYAATTLDEVEYLLNRSLGFDLPFGMETHFDELKANGLTPKVFDLIGKYEHLRLYGNIPLNLREKLQRPVEEFIAKYQLLKEQYRLGGYPPFFYRFYRQAYFEKVLRDGENWDFVNPFHEQPLQVKITALPGVAPADSAGNFELLDKTALTLHEKKNNNYIEEYPPGNIIVHATYDKTTGQITADYQTPDPQNLSEYAWCSLGHDLNENLIRHKVIFVDLEGDGKGAVLNIQLTDDKGNHRVYQVILEAGVSYRRQFVLHQPTTIDFYRYPPLFGGILNFKYFDFSNVRKLSLYIQHIREGAGNEVNITLHAIKALRQDIDTTVQNPTLTLNQKALKFPFELHPEKTDYGPGDLRNREPWEYAELAGFIRRKYDGNHQPLSMPMPLWTGSRPLVKNGANTLLYSSNGSGLALVRIVVEDRGTAL